MDMKIIKKYFKWFIKYLIGTILFSLYIAFVIIHWTVPYTDYWIKLIIFGVVIFVLANIAAKANAIHSDSQRRRRTLRAMEEGQSRVVQAEIELKSLKDENSNVVEKSLNEKTVESIAEAIVHDIEHEVSQRLSNDNGNVIVVQPENESSLKDVQKT